MKKRLDICMFGHCEFLLSCRLTKEKNTLLKKCLSEAEIDIQKFWYDEDLTWEVIEQDIWDWYSDEDGIVTLETSGFVFDNLIR